MSYTGRIHTTKERNSGALFDHRNIHKKTPYKFYGHINILPDTPNNQENIIILSIS